MLCCCAAHHLLNVSHILKPTQGVPVAALHSKTHGKDIKTHWIHTIRRRTLNTQQTHPRLRSCTTRKCLKRRWGAQNSICGKLNCGKLNCGKLNALARTRRLWKTNSMGVLRKCQSSTTKQFVCLTHDSVLAFSSITDNFLILERY